MWYRHFTLAGFFHSTTTFFTTMIYGRNIDRYVKRCSRENNSNPSEIPEIDVQSPSISRCHDKTGMNQKHPCGVTYEEKIVSCETGVTSKEKLQIDSFYLCYCSPVQKRPRCH